MFTINVDTQKLTDAEKILALGEPENLAKMDFALVDAAGQPVNAENCQFDLLIGDVSCPRYKTDGNTVSFRYVALEIAKAQTEFALTMQKDGAAILNDSIKVTAEVQKIVLPDVTVTADAMLKDITAINTAGEVVTGNISDAVITTDETIGLTVNVSKGYVAADETRAFDPSVITTDQTNGLTVNISKGYVAADETRAFDPSVVTETENQVTISRGWLNEDKAFQVGGGGSSEVQGIVYDNRPNKATTVQIIPETFTADWTDFSNMFYNCTSLTSISQLDTSNGTIFSYMFYSCSGLTSVPALDTSNGTNFSNMFNSCRALTTVPQLDTSNGTTFSYMFNNCSALTSAPTLDTSNGTNFSYMFQGCSGLTSAPTLDTSNGTNFSYMFQGCSGLTSVPALDTSNGTNFNGMFHNCSSLTSVPALDTSNGTNLGYMFYNCSKLTTIEGIDFSSATSTIASNIFQNCSALTSVKVNGIIPVAIDISQAPNLDLTSLNRFCWGLQTKTSGVFYLTLTQTQYNQLSSSIINEVKNKGWGFKIA